LLAGSTFLFILFFVSASCLIGREIKKFCVEAKKDYGGSCTDALISFVKDKTKDFGKRNLASGH